MIGPIQPHRRALARGIAALALFAAAVTTGAWYYHHRGGSAVWRAASDDPNGRLLAAADLGDSTSGVARETLVRLAGDASVAVAVQAVQSLGRNVCPANREAMSSLLTSPHLRPEARAEALAEMGRFPDADPHPLIAALAADDDARIRAGAAMGLTRLRNPAALPELSRRLEDPDPRVRIWAITGIHRMITRRFPYDAKADPATQAAVIRKIRTYLRSCGVKGIE